MVKRIPASEWPVGRRIRLTGLLRKPLQTQGFYLSVRYLCKLPLLPSVRPWHASCAQNRTAYPREGEAGFSQTETCFVLSLVNGSRFQPLQRSRNVIPASRAIRSSSDGHT
jgi:hypothetical protein